MTTGTAPAAVVAPSVDLTELPSIDDVVACQSAWECDHAAEWLATFTPCPHAQALCTEHLEWGMERMARFGGAVCPCGARVSADEIAVRKL